MAKIIELKPQENSPFENEPQLLGVYHWSYGLRSMHMHEDRLELNFILSGNGTHVIGGEICNFQAGDMLIHNCGVLHDENLLVNAPINAWCIAVTNFKLENLPPNTILPKNFHPRIPCQAVAEQLAQIYSLVHDFAQNDYQIANSLARAVVLIVHKIIKTEARAATTEENILVEKIRRYIEAHYAENLSLSDLANVISVNEYYLAHSFKKVTNYSPQQYIMRRRIGKAQCLLIYTQLPITEIAYQVGYEDSDYFSRVFKKLIGTSPREYRKSWLEHSIGSVPSDV